MIKNNAIELLDNASIRRNFPALATKIYGRPLIYLDNAASAQKPQCVLDSMQQAYTHSYANVHRGLHYLANAATELYEQARVRVQKFINAESSDSIIFTKNATEAINLVAYSWAMAHLQAGDEIILSLMEHHSNLVPWHFLRERLGVKLVFLPVAADGSFAIESLDKALNKRTKLVAITHMSNILGTILPVKEIVKRAHADNIPVLLDGAQAAVHERVNVGALDCDFYVLTGHKLYGPSGIGVLYGKRALLAAMRPFLGGGEMIETVEQNAVVYNAPPHRFEAGTPPIIEAVGLGQALDYLENLGRGAVHLYEQELLAYAQARLAVIKDLRLLGTAKGKGPIIAFNLADIHPHDLAMFLDRQGIAVRAGTHCAQPLLNNFGLTAVCRASFGLYNNKAEIDVLAAELERAKAFFS
ncbi:aminotransferase class V-fold PLP-dependent enzyme [Candidatus Tokpelaia sp.]|uniref:aminotransferase class V-fold PLP-dependent enzyme n=1 Tax=Candidatus Tokpelaia sp. TaxID=2233777 RepID=UPI00123BE16A|nr:cysteine desulfurase [Candidatus Tokpelaia sp.]KAA6404785.1 cysteine desulfurase [Candidatus Tokpelaia sp.]